MIETIPGGLKYQAARCMDCDVPFCQSDTGCPISNIIPKWNESESVAGCYESTVDDEQLSRVHRPWCLNSTHKGFYVYNMLR